jgi:DNA-binding SARP family transcriptional activator
MTQLSQERIAALPASDPDGRWSPSSPPTGSRAWRLLAAAALVVLVLGVPAALALSIGWPLPRSLPDPGGVQGTLSDPLEAALVIKVLAIVAWTGWTHFTLCVVAELAAAVRARRSGSDRQPIRVPLGGPSQQLARRLVEAALVTATIATSVTAFSGTMLTAARPAVAAQEPVTARPVALAAHAPGTPGPAPATVSATAAPSPERPPEYVVQPPHGGYYDSLWGIAERFLGDGQRWREIYELNRDREQPDGKALRRPELIRPGWCLRLPPDAKGFPETASDEAPVTGWVPDAAADPAPVAEAAPAPAVAATAAPPLPSPAIHPPVPSPTAMEGRAPELVSPTSAPASGDDGPPAPAVPEDEQDDRRFVPDGAVGGLLAAAALAGLATLRHRQRRRRAGGQAVPRPQKPSVREEGRLRVLAEPDDMTHVEEALRALTLAIPGEDPLPDVRVVLLREGHVDLVLSESRPDAPPPFVEMDEGLTWRAPASARPLLSPAEASRALPLLPLLLTVGRTSEGLVMLDLEAVGSLAVEGPDTDVTGVLSHLVAEASLAPWADGVEVLLVGFDGELARNLQQLAPDRVTALDHLDASMLRALGTRATRVAAAGDRLRTRVHASGPGAQAEVRPPLLVVCAAPPPEELVALVPDEGRGGCALVAPGPWADARATWLLDGPLPVPGHTTHPVPCLLDRERVHSLAEGLRLARTPAPVQAAAADAGPAPSPRYAQEANAVAESPPQAPTLQPVIPALTESSVTSPDREKSSRQGDELDAAVAAYLHGTAPATVSLLGPVTVEAGGHVEPDRRSRLTEIVAYLAMHRRGAAVSDFDAAIWPERPVSLKTRNQAITRARAWLGGDAEGVSWLRPMTDGALRLSRQVVVDWELFQALDKRSTERDRLPVAVRRDLETAMRLVRGKPLSQLPTGRYGWLAETFLEQEIPSAVVDVAHRLARVLLEDGDPEGVLEVARLALEVDRYDERPWRDLLEAHDLCGEHRQIELLVCQLRELLDVELDDELQPETAELVERLLPHRRRA